jgi:hypothetical protein
MIVVTHGPRVPLRAGLFSPGPGCGDAEAWPTRSSSRLSKNFSSPSGGRKAAMAIQKSKADPSNARQILRILDEFCSVQRFARRYHLREFRGTCQAPRSLAAPTDSRR